MPVDLVPVVSGYSPSVAAEKRAEEIVKLHKRVKESIEAQNARYKLKADKGRRDVVFQPGDLVWVHLRKERFPGLRKNKLSPRAEGPFKIVARINPNAYKVELPGEYGVSASFNVQDLVKYEGDDEPTALRAKRAQQGENDPGKGPREEPLSRPANEEQEQVSALFEQVSDDELEGDSVGSQSEWNGPPRSALGSCGGLVTLLTWD